MLTLREALTRATDQLSMHPDLRPTALPDAAVLLMHTLQIERPTLIAHPERKLDREQQATYQRLIERRLTFEPIQYILGTQDFYGLTLRVTPAVLIPRPETEQLVEAVLEAAKNWVPHPSESHPEGWGALPSQPTPSVPRPSESHPDEWVHPKLRILDIGTGTGAIAIALAVHVRQAKITAIDLSVEALAIARENARTHNVQIDFLQSDLLDALATPLHETTRSVENARKWDIIVSNPPYIPAAEYLHPQVTNHEPHTALFAGPTGLDLYARLIPQAAAHLVPGGLLAMEIGHGQRDDIAHLLADWHSVTFLNDLQQIPRVVLASRP